MDLKQLRALVTVADTGSVTKASTLLNLVQPAVSRQLRLLEEDLGAELFDRSSQGMELNEAGKIFVQYARRVLGELERARAEVRPTKGSIGGVVTVGLLPSTCDLLSSALVAQVAISHPGIRVRIAMGYTGMLQAWLESGEVDTALLDDVKSSPAIRVKPLLEEELWVVGLPSCGLQMNKPLPLRELEGRPLVLPSSIHALRTLVEHAASSIGLTLNVVAETNALSVQKSLVFGGHGLTVLPTIAVAGDFASGRLIGAPIMEPALVRKIVVGTSTIRHTTTPVRCVVEVLVKCMKDAVERGDWRAARWCGE